MGWAGRNLAALMGTIQTMHHSEAMIHGLRFGLGLLVELIANVIAEGGFGEIGNRMLPPAGKVKQVVSVSAQRSQRKTAQMLSVEERVGPIDFAMLFVY
jgi:hypothetical protein